MIIILDSKGIFWIYGSDHNLAKTCDMRVVRQKGNLAIRRVYKGLKGGVYVHSGNDHNIWGANQFSTFMRTRAAL
jgi:hypothetical protein